MFTDRDLENLWCFLGGVTPSMVGLVGPWEIEVVGACEVAAAEVGRVVDV